MRSVSFAFDCRSCASHFDPGSSFDGWSQTEEDRHVLSYLAAGETQTFELLLAVKPYWGEMTTSWPEKLNVSITGWR